MEFSPVTEKNVMYLFCLRSADCLPLFTKFPFIHKIANESSRKLQVKKKDIKNKQYKYYTFPQHPIDNIRVF